MLEWPRAAPFPGVLLALRSGFTFHACLGFALALAAAVLATLGTAHLAGMPLTLAGLYRVQSDNPGLLVLDIMPLVFALWIQYVSVTAAGSATPRNSSERPRPEDAVQPQADAPVGEYDALTGLVNGARFLESLEAGLASARIRGGRLAILVADLDGFCEVNEQYGATCGDRVLKCVARRLAMAMPESFTLARLSGDCFAILVPSLTSPEQAVGVARHVEHSLNPPCVLDDLVLNLSASIGGAIYPDNAHTSQELLATAKNAMLAVKVRGGGFELARAQRLLHGSEIHSLSAELRAAIDDDQLVLHLQPIVDVSTNQVNGVEALVRWQHPRRGLIMPQNFIPRIERGGFVQDLSNWVLERAVRETADLHRKGWPLQMSVNLSALSLLDPDFPDFLAERLRAFDLPAHFLTLEITEDTLMSDQRRALDNIARVNDLGTQISIDDFGTGYSQLAYLKRLQASEIKIDRSFVKDMLVSHTDRSIVQATIDLAHALDLRVVGEGVESERQSEQLRQLGCDLLQGFFYARPMSVACLVEWLAERRRGHFAAGGVSETVPEPRTA